MSDETVTRHVEELARNAALRGLILPSDAPWLHANALYLLATTPNVDRCAGWVEFVFEKALRDWRNRHPC